MQFKKITTGLACVALLGAMNANAELVKGDLEVSGSLSFQQTEFGPFEQESTTLFLSGGKMLTDNFQGVLGLFVTGDDNNTSGQITVGGDYLFSPRSELIPYVGASYALAVGDNDDTDFLQLKGGIKTFISETTSVLLSTECWKRLIQTSIFQSGRWPLA